MPLDQQFKMTVVLDTKTLSSTLRELECIKFHVPNDCLVQLGIPGSPATVESVIPCLSTSSIIHFACHGSQNRLNPLDSALHLQKDQYLTISKIMQQKNIPKGTLAFLCACETAMGDEKLPDQAMSIGASLIFSGFSSVVATMW